MSKDKLKETVYLVKGNYKLRNYLLISSDIHTILIQLRTKQRFQIYVNLAIFNLNSDLYVTYGSEQLHVISVRILNFTKSIHNCPPPPKLCRLFINIPNS